jgi:hypothetical protein
MLNDLLVWDLSTMAYPGRASHIAVRVQSDLL